MATYSTFNNLAIGTKFKTPAGITYQKTSTTEFKPLFDKQGNNIDEGQVSSAFYNTQIQLEIVP
jgi:hypothetical protein